MDRSGAVYCWSPWSIDTTGCAISGDWDFVGWFDAIALNII